MKREWNLSKKVIAMLLTIPLLFSTVSPALSVSAESSEAAINKTSWITFETYDGSDQATALPEDVSFIGTNATVDAAPGTGHGSYSLEHEGVGANKGTLRIDYPLEAGHTYQIKISHYFYTTDELIAGTRWFALLACQSETAYATALSANPGYNTWATTTVQYTPTDDYSYLKLNVSVPSGVVGYFDDIKITDLSTSMPTIENATYFATGFSDVQTVDVMPIWTGNNADVTYKNDADYGIVAECSLGSKLDAYNMIYFPYTLKANATYKVTMIYKVSKWACWSMKGAGGNLGALDKKVWTTVTKTITPTSSDYLGIGTVGAGRTITIASIRIQECVENSADYQLYDFDYNTLSGPTVNTIEEANGAENKVAYFSGDTKNTTLGAALTSGETYKMSMDYKGKGTFSLTAWEGSWADAKGQYISQTTPKLPTTDETTIKVTNQWVLLDSDVWRRYEVIFQADYAHASLAINSTFQTSMSSELTASALYFDNICIEKLTACTATLTDGENGTATVTVPYEYVGETATYTATPDIGYVFTGWKDVNTGLIIATSSEYEHVLAGSINLQPVFELADKADYYEDFESVSESPLIESSKYIEPSIVEDRSYGNALKVEFSKGTDYEQIAKIPYLCLRGTEYRITLTYKVTNYTSDKQAIAFMQNGDTSTAKRLNITDEWKTQTWYITNDTENFVLGFGASENALTLYLADITIEYGRDVAGDVNNNGVCDPTDRELLAKVLVGLLGESDNAVFTSYLDVNIDTELDIRDIVRLKTIINNTASTTLVDECANLTTAVCCYSNIAVERSETLGDTSRFRLAASDQDAYVVYQIDGGTTEAAVQYDFPEKYYQEGDFIFEVSSDMSNWKRVYPQDVAADVIVEHGWVLRTSYFANLGFMPFFRITYPDGYKVSSSPGIRKVQFNGLDEEALVSIGGYNSNLREATTLYVDSQNGNDENSGLSTGEALKTLQAVAKKNLVPGDQILLKSGQEYTGGVTLLCSGTEESPILISSYGDGDKPIINDFGGSVGIRITGEYVHVENLAFSCETGYAGLDVYAVAGGASKGLSVRGCDFSEINSTSDSTNKAKYLSGGLHFIARGNQPTWFEGVCVEGNTFDKVARTAIYVTSFWVARDTANQTTQNLNFGIGVEDGIPTEYLSTDVRIRSNTITNNGGDAIMVSGVDGAFVEYNVVTDTKLLHEYTDTSSTTGRWEPAFAAVWCYCSDNVVFQYNEVSGTSGDNGGHDLQAFDIDFSSNNCIVQYNYSHNNEGGFVLFAAYDESTNSQITNSIVRYNLSVNDGGSRTNPPLAVIDITGSVLNSHIYNNTIYCGDNYVRLINFANYSNATTKSTTLIENNIFYAAEGVTATWGYGDTNTTPAFASATFNNNLLYNISEPVYTGTYATLTVSDTLTGDPLFVNAGTVGAGRLTVGEAYQLQSGSPALSGGKVIGAFGQKED